MSSYIEKLKEMMSDHISVMWDREGRELDNLIDSHILPPDERNTKAFVIDRVKEVSEHLSPIVGACDSKYFCPCCCFFFELKRRMFDVLSDAMKGDDEVVVAFLVDAEKTGRLVENGPFVRRIFSEASETMRDNKDLLVFAFCEARHMKEQVLESASLRLRSDRELIMMLSKHCDYGEAYAGASEDLRKDLDLIKFILTSRTAPIDGRAPGFFSKVPFSIAIRKEFILLTLQKTTLCGRFNFESLYDTRERRIQAFELFGSDVEIVVKLIQSVRFSIDQNNRNFRPLSYLEPYYVLKRCKMMDELKFLTKKLAYLGDPTLKTYLVPPVVNRQNHFSFKKWNRKIQSEYSMKVELIEGIVASCPMDNDNDGQRNRKSEAKDKICAGVYTSIAEYAGFDCFVKQKECIVKVKQLEPLIRQLYSCRIHLFQIFGYQRKFWEADGTGDDYVSEDDSDSDGDDDDGDDEESDDEEDF